MSCFPDFSKLTNAKKPQELLQIHTDHLGTPRAVTDKTKNVLWRWEGDQFGDVRPQIQTIKLPLRHAGQYHDSETGLFYNWHRYYVPELGRYNRTDDLGLDDGSNPYIYVGADPLTYFDPNGQARMVRNPRRGGFGRSNGGLRWNTPRQNKRWIMQQNIRRERERRRKEAQKSCTCDPLIPESYWIKGRSDYWRRKTGPEYFTPGYREVHYYNKPSSGGGTYHQTSYYDAFGRLIGRTDRTTHGMPREHPNPHHHRFDFGGGYIRHPNGTRVWPGSYCE